MKTLHKTKSSFCQIKAKNPASGNSGTSKPAHQLVNPIIVSDDRIGSDEPLDEANEHEGEAPGPTTETEGILTSDHRIRNIEPGDEHKNENLIEEGLQGYLRGSLTKPRKTT